LILASIIDCLINKDYQIFIKCKIMRITIIGSGAIGGMAGAYMAMANEDVLFVDRWVDHVKSMNEKGLKITGVRGDKHVNVKAATPEQINEPLELVIFATKTHHTVRAVQGVLEYITPETTVVSLQNGFNVWEIAKLVPNGTRQVIGAVPGWTAALVAPGHLELVSMGRVVIGELDGQITSRIKNLEKLLSHLTEANVSTNIAGDIWMKQVYFSMVTLTALVNAPIEDIWEAKRCRWMSIALVQEAMKVPLALGVSLPSGPFHDTKTYNPQTPEDTKQSLKFMEKRLESARRSPDVKLVKIASGPWWDIVYRKRKSETTGLTGAVVDWAKRLGVPVPANAKLCEMIYDIEDQTRKLGWHNIDELEAYMTEIGCVLP
jgi:2-dehydropantoate 2-reductase